MKTINNLLFLILLTSTGLSFGQVRIVTTTLNTIAANSSAFIDASSNSVNNLKTNIGKGLIYPRVDLTAFAAFSGTPTGIATSYPTRFDGMVVYNTANGIAGIGSSVVNPGFYYYSNQTTNVNGGKWVRMNDGNITSTPKGTSFPAASISNAGDVFYRTDLMNFFFYNGSDWLSTSQTPIGTTLPDVETASVGDTYFKSDDNTFYVFNNGAWRLINGSGSTLANGMLYVGNESNIATATAKTSIPLSGFGDAASDVSMGANKITNLANPVSAQDAATKQYVDNNMSEAHEISVSNDGVLAFNVPFVLNTNSLIFFNGQAILKNQWSGVGTAIIHLNLDTKLYDNITVKR